LPARLGTIIVRYNEFKIRCLVGFMVRFRVAQELQLREFVPIVDDSVIIGLGYHRTVEVK
jgi:hypothetical protein